MLHINVKDVSECISTGWLQPARHNPHKHHTYIVNYKVINMLIFCFKLKLSTLSFYIQQYEIHVNADVANMFKRLDSFLYYLDYFLDLLRYSFLC